MKASATKAGEHAMVDDSLSLFSDGIEKQIGKHKPGLWLTASVIMAGFVVACGGAYWVYDNYLKHYGERPMVYYEIKAIDPSGHPVAGANVRLAKHENGVTDSFGEWRKYVATERGSSVHLELTKETGAGVLWATKNLVVPLRPPKKGDLSIVKTIAMTIKPSPEALAQRVKPAAARWTGEQVPDRTEVGLPQVPTTASVSEEVVEEPQEAGTGEPEDLFGFDRVNLTVRERVFSTHNQLGKERYDLLKGPTLHLLKKAAIGAGIAIDPGSPWKVELTHLSVGKGRSLIQVESQYEGMTKSYLRNYYSNPEQTAHKILTLLKVHAWKPYLAMKDGTSWFAVLPTGSPRFWMPKVGSHLLDPNGVPVKVTSLEEQGNFTKYGLAAPENGPCANNLAKDGRCFLRSANFHSLRPRSDWTRQSITINGGLGRGEKLFFAGFEGTYLEGAGRVQYWGKSGHGTNLTIVKNDTVVLRKRLINGKPGSLRISIPVSTVARR